jgi:predicted phage terminase large subunit-like protein
VINSLALTVSGLIAIEPDGNKISRARAVSPFVEAGQVYLPSPELCPWVVGFIDEHALFPNAVHDDRVDTMSQALNRLLLNPITSGEIVGADDFEEITKQISPY